MRDRFIACGKPFGAKAIYDKNVEPAVIVVIVKGDSTAGSLEQVLIFVLSTEDGFYVQAGFASDIQKTHIQVRDRNDRLVRIGFLERTCKSVRCWPAHQAQDAFERQDQRGPAERLQ